MSMNLIVTIYTHLVFIVITLSSNARRVPFEYPQIYLNKREKFAN